MTDALDLRARADAVLELHEGGDLEAALALASEVADTAESSDTRDPVVRESLFTARLERALLLTELGELAAAADAYREAAATPADAGDPDQRHEVAMALLNRGICFDAMDDRNAALSAYDEVVARFGDADDAMTHDQVVRARVNRAASLLAAGRPVDALSEAEALVHGLDRRDVLEAAQRAMAGRVQAAALRALGRVDEAAAVLADLGGVVGDEPAMTMQVAGAQRDRAELLAELGRLEEAVDVLEAVVTRLRDDPDPAVLEIVTDLIDEEVRLLDALGDRARANAVRSGRPS